VLDKLRGFFVVHPPVPFEAEAPATCADRSADVIREAWRRAKSGAELIEFYRSAGYAWVVPAA
jgi:hypothetical protein